jgi:hypothetical protein
MSARRVLLFAITVGIGLLPHAGVTGGQHEVGHWLGLYFPEGPSSPTHLTISSSVIDSTVVSNGVIFRVDDVSVKLLNCLEFETTRDGLRIAYASFAPAGMQTGESDLEFIKILLEDGVSTEADVGYSAVRTSPDRCGAALARLQRVGSITLKHYQPWPVA